MMNIDLLQKPIKCANCNKPLSVPPIHYNDSIGSICGRCTNKQLINENNNSPLIRQRVFEDIAKFLCFPCSYQVFGCRAELQWGSVECHENICTFKNIVCPLSHKYFQEKCSWVDDHNNLAEHIKEKHKNLFCSPPLMKITKKFENRILFWELTGRVIIIILVFKNTLNKYFCCITGDFIPERCCLFQSQVSIFGDDWTRPSIVQHKGIQTFNAKNVVELETGFQIDVDHFKHLFSTSEELTLKFTISEVVNSAKPGLNERLLSQLECPVCFEYMKPPIFICQKGHNFCVLCSNKIETCPICRGNLLGGRNFTLEALTTAVLYPCVYKHFGCTFVALSEEVKCHERYCPYVGRKCFVNRCEWKGLHDVLLEHIENQHPHTLHQLDTIYCYNLSVKNETYLLPHNGDIFLLKISFELNQPFKFAVLHYEREATSYNYEFQIMGCSPYINITLSNSCQPVPFHDDIMTFNNHSVTSLPPDFILQFMLSYSQIEFKLNIISNKV